MIENRFPKDRETDCLSLGCQRNNPDLLLSKSTDLPNLETYLSDKETAQLTPQEKETKPRMKEPNLMVSGNAYCVHAAQQVVQVIGGTQIDILVQLYYCRPIDG